MSDDFDDEDADAVALVRPYSRTRGRTRSSVHLALETLVSTTDLGRMRDAELDGAHHPIAELCTQSRSVAEIAAMLQIPLGVARVLISDMVGLDLVVVHHDATQLDASGGVPMELMERVLAGLQRL